MDRHQSGSAEPFSQTLDRLVTVHQLRLLVEVIDRGGFSRAAEALGLSQPAISHQMKALSTGVGLPLLEVVGRRVRLTQAGTLVYEHAKRILAEFEDAGAALDELRGLRRGTIRMAGDTTVGIYVLPDLLGAFRHEYPSIEVRLGVDNRQGVYDRLVAGEVDFVVVGRPWVNASIPLIVRPFLDNELIAIASPRHRLAGRAQVTLAELAAEPFIGREPGSGTRETAEEALRAAGLAVRPVMELASNGAIKRAVARDLGVSILSRYATALELQIGHLVELPVVGFPLRRQWHLAYARDRRLGPVDEAFLRFVDSPAWRDTLGRPVTTE
ncbi:MAG TPA: LysR family transcriptional regulator [Candidatus Limnocylindrales bacterium]|nr:LysR family transcriptional regulator [Candidatus Limnocylindrales bacterium]